MFPPVPVVTIFATYIVSVTVALPPTFKLPPMPAPPVTINAPLVVEELTVAVLTVNPVLVVVVIRLAIDVLPTNTRTTPSDEPNTKLPI